MKKKILLVGGFHEVIELCEMADIDILGIIDSKKEAFYLGYPIVGDDNAIDQLKQTYRDIPIFITPDSPKVRKFLHIKYASAGFEFTSLIHPGAEISKTANIGIGSIIHNCVSISSHSKIGDFVKVNTGANITHDVNIKNYCTISPGAVILSHSNIGEMCFIGGNATILPKIEVGHNSTIGAAAVVTKNIKTNDIVIGNPARSYENSN